MLENTNSLNLNSETGEIEILHSEKNDFELTNLDKETGEENDLFCNLKLRKTKFNIPSYYLNNNINKNKTDNKCCLSPNTTDCYTLTNKRNVINLKEDIILGYNKTSHLLFLIPSLLFFFKITAILIALAEIILHIYAHKKNSKNLNPLIYYRTPLYLLTKNFCAICRTKNEMQIVGNIQTERLKLFKNKCHLRHVTG